MNKPISIGFIILCLLGIGLVIILNTSFTPKQKNFTIGLVNPNPGSKKLVEGFVKGLAEYGYKEGENVTFIRCKDKKQLNKALTEMTAKPVDLIFTVTTPATKMAKMKIKDKEIPLVFAMYDPINSGIITNLSSSHKNITGIQIRGSVEKSLEWLLQISPETKHIFVPIRHDTKASTNSLEELIVAANKAQVKYTVSEANNKKELLENLNSISSSTDAIYLLHSMLISESAKDIVKIAERKKIPVGGSLGKADEGALFSYGPNLNLMGKQASRLAQQLLSKSSYHEVPAEMADFFLVINLKTAEQTGIRISNDILLQADKIIR